MKPPRSALPLPRYVERKPLKSGGWGYFFHVPSWAKKAGCAVHSERLGTDYQTAVSRAETLLLPAFDAWRTGSSAPAALSSISTFGTLDWIFAEYRSDRRYTKLDPKSKRNHEVGFKLVGGYVLKDGKRLGEKRLSAIDTALTDDLYEKLLILKITDAEGNVIERERRTTVNHAMKSCRRAWNVVARRHPGRLPLVNPFSQMGLRSSNRETPTAAYEELVAFRTKPSSLGFRRWQPLPLSAGNGSSARPTSLRLSTCRIIARKSARIWSASSMRRPGRRAGYRCSTMQVHRFIPS